jgi:hypothetical protein
MKTLRKVFLNLLLIHVAETIILTIAKRIRRPR